MQVEGEGEEVEMKHEDGEDEATLAAKLAAKKIKAAAAGKKSKKKSGGEGEEDDLAAYNLDTYDEEESKGAGKSTRSHLSTPSADDRALRRTYSDGSFLQYQGIDLLWKYGR